jgi:polysaccharide pyruvyl transferase WcaK-like protein
VLAGVPFVALAYATKVAGFLDGLQLQTPMLEQVSAGALIAHVDRAWDRRDELRVRIRQMLPELQERARVNGQLAVRVLSQPRQQRGAAGEASPPPG